MILTVTLNPAYDVTYRVDRMERGGAQRVQAVEMRPGGKGVNVARVLNATGTYAVASGLADADFAEFAAEAVPVDFVLGLPRVRRTLVVTEADGTATGLWEPGATVRDSSAIDTLMTRVRALLPQTSGLVISGSLPGGVRSSLPAELARMAVAAGVPVICDVDGEALRYAVAVAGVVLMPNTEELRELTGFVTHSATEVVRAVRPLLTNGVHAVVATRGSDGMVAVTSGGAWFARLPEPVAGNPTGAGDAAAAAVISHLAASAHGAVSAERKGWGDEAPPDSDAPPGGVPPGGVPPGGVSPGRGAEPDNGAAQPLSPTHLPGDNAPHPAASGNPWNGAVSPWPALLADAVATSAAAVAAPVAGELDLSLRAHLLRKVRVYPVSAPNTQEFSCP